MGMRDVLATPGWVYGAFTLLSMIFFKRKTPDWSAVMTW